MVTGLISPFDVHAASVPGQYDVVDLLASGFFPEGELVLTKAATSYTFNWDVTSSASLAFVYINVYAPTAPSAVTLNGVTGTRVYSGAFYQYRFAMSRVLSSCKVVVMFSSSASRTVSIGYAVGSVSGQSVFTSYRRRSRGYSSATWGSPVTVQIPGGGAFVSAISSDIPSNQRVNDFELIFDCNMAAADYFTVHLLVPAGAGGMVDGWRSAYATPPSFFLGSSFAHTYPLDIINVDSYYDAATQIGYGRGSWHMVYTVDVSGYKLDSYDVMCDFTLFGVQSPDDPSRYGFHYSCLSTCLGLNVDDGSPWRAFISWLGTQFTSIKSSIASLGNTIASQFSSLKTSLSSWFSSLESKIQSAINPTPNKNTTDSQQGVRDDISAMDQFEQDGFGKIENGMSDMQADISTGVNSFLPALSFIRKYTDHVASGISDYLLVFTLPVFVGLFLFICNRLPGVTRFGSSKPKKED